MIRPRILFLDFDGVLHPFGCSIDRYFCHLGLLEAWLAPHPDVRLVVHSTWRHEHDIGELREMLGPLSERVIGATEGVGRLESIEGWLSAHPEVSSYRILDDDESDFFGPPELILCNPARGIADKRAQQKLLAWLAETPDSPC